MRSAMIHPLLTSLLSDMLQVDPHKRPTCATILRTLEQYGTETMVRSATHTGRRRSRYAACAAHAPPHVARCARGPCAARAPAGRGAARPCRAPRAARYPPQRTGRARGLWPARRSGRRAGPPPCVWVAALPGMAVVPRAGRPVRCLSDAAVHPPVTTLAWRSARC